MAITGRSRLVTIRRLPPERRSHCRNYLAIQTPIAAMQSLLLRYRIGQLAAAICFSIVFNKPTILYSETFRSAKSDSGHLLLDRVDRLIRLDLMRSIATEHII